jgi:hypothetical protein
MPIRDEGITNLTTHQREGRSDASKKILQTYPLQAHQYRAMHHGHATLTCPLVGPNNISEDV